MGTSSCDCWRWRGAAASVFPMRIMILQCSEPAPVHHHLEPLMTYSRRVSSREIEIPMLVASLEATLGSCFGSKGGGWGQGQREGARGQGSGIGAVLGLELSVSQCQCQCDGEGLGADLELGQGRDRMWAR